MLSAQTITQRFEGLEMAVGGRTQKFDLVIEASPTGVVVEAIIGRKKHRLSIASKRLARHIFFSSGRSTRDAEIGGNLVDCFRKAKEK